MVRTLITALALVACNGDESRTAPGIPIGGLPDTDVDTECVDSGGCDPSPWFDVMYLTWSAQFGYDATTGSLTAIGTPYGPVEPSIDLFMGTKQWKRSGFDAGDTAEYCLVSLPLRDSVVPGWASGPTLWYGVSYDSNVDPITTCGLTGYELDPSQWSDDPARLIADQDYGTTWGVGIGELSANAEAIVTSAFRPEDVPYVFGGAIAVPLLGGLDADVYAFGYVIDEIGNVRIGTDGSLEAWLASEVRSGANGAGVPRAWYNVVALYIYMLSP